MKTDSCLCIICENQCQTSNVWTVLEQNIGKLETSSKFERLKKLLESTHFQSSWIIFSKYATSLRLLKMYMETPAWQIAVNNQKLYFIYGKITKADRSTILEKMEKQSNKFILLITIKTGGVGLNLTAAQVVVIFDPQWNPSVEKQAQDRIHRIEQTKTPYVYRFLSNSPLDVKISAIQQRKLEQSDLVLNNKTTKQQNGPSMKDLEELVSATRSHL